jgi:membrane-associated protease RseP (regulator of RpoE activity)
MKSAQVLCLLLAAWLSGCYRWEPYVLRDYQIGESKEVAVGSVMVAWGEGERQVSSTDTSSTIWSGLRMELSYSGIAQNVVHIAYREYSLGSSGAYARPAFYQDLLYDISGLKKIAFRDFKIEIEDANVQRIRFRITQGPTISQIGAQMSTGAVSRISTNIQEATDGLSAGGVGIKVDKSGEILQVAPSGPASKSGIMRGDIIRKIDGEPIPGNDARAIISKIHGQPGTKVRLEIARDSRHIEFNIVRRER